MAKYLINFIALISKKEKNTINLKYQLVLPITELFSKQ